MSFDRLQQEIANEAAKEAAVVVERYRKSVSDEETRIKEAAQRIEEDIISQAKTQAEQEVRRLHQETQLRARADVLQAKQEEINSTRDQVVADILARDDEPTEQMIIALLALIPSDAGMILPGAHHADVVKRLAAETKHEVAKETIEGEGGFVWRGPDANLNLTVSFLVDQIFARHRTEIARLLFG